MRNPDRIDAFMQEMGSLWKENCPDWRFGQLMYNFFSVLGDPFYYEEDELLVGFRAYCNRENPKDAIKKLHEEKIKKQSELDALKLQEEQVQNFFTGLDVDELLKKLKKKAEQNKEEENDADDLK